MESWCSASTKKEGDNCSDDGSLLLESLFTPPPAPRLPGSSCASNGSNGESTNEAAVVLVEEQVWHDELDTTTVVQTMSSETFSRSLHLYFSSLAMDFDINCENLVIVVDNAHIPLSAEHHLLADKDANYGAFSRSLSAINTVSFPPPFLMTVNDESDVSSRWDSIAIRRRGSSSRLVNHAESDLGPQKPGRTCDDYYESEPQSIDKTMHTTSNRFTAGRCIKSPVLIKKTPRRRRRTPIVPTNRTTTTTDELRHKPYHAPGPSSSTSRWLRERSTTTTTTTEELRRKPYNAPGPSSSLDSTSRWLRELPRRGDSKPTPPCPHALLRRSRSPSRVCGEGADDINGRAIAVADGERRKQDLFQPDASKWTVWFDEMSSITSSGRGLHDRGCDIDPAEDIGLIDETNETSSLHQGTTFKLRLEGRSDFKPSGSSEVASWDEVISMERSRRANPSSLVNQLIMIDNRSPTDPFQRITRSPASHFKSEQTPRKNFGLLVGQGSPTNPFEREKSLVSASSHSQ